MYIVLVNLVGLLDPRVRFDVWSVGLFCRRDHAASLFRVSFQLTLPCLISLDLGSS